MTQDEILKIIASRKKKTNCFTFYDEIQKWAQTEKAYFHLASGNVFVFFKANSFLKFYYYVDEFEDIKLAKPFLEKYGKDNDITLEFTTKNELFLDEIKEILSKIGFEFYAEFARLITKKANLNFANQTKYFLATQDDKKELLDIMNSEFDKLKDDIVDEAELSNLIDKGTVLIYKIDGKIVYIQIYEYFKRTIYSRITWIKKEFRKPKYMLDFYGGADTFFRDLLKNGMVFDRSYCWIDKNIRNFKIATKNGSELDGLTSTIFLYKNL